MLSAIASDHHIPHTHDQGGGAAVVSAAVAVAAVAAVVYEEILLHSVHGATADDNVMPYETPTVLNQNSAYEKSIHPLLSDLNKHWCLC